MTRHVLSSLAVATLFAVGMMTPALSQSAAKFSQRVQQNTQQSANLSGPGPVACDCTNCSAEDCPKPKPPRSGGGGMDGLKLLAQVAH